ncbi:DUF3696 domain-containing protein [Phycicoccus elongatus]|uniref:DUF3696 domain-containing protein n=1 Tax=Phycicoccus elongatus TaxID=101689 RepID=UPI003D80D585
MRNSSEIRELELDLFGNILNWPAGFFGDLTQESLAMMEAIERRETWTDRSAKTWKVGSFVNGRGM